MNKATRQRRINELVGVLRLEIATAVARTDAPQSCAPPSRKRKAQPPRLLQPCEGGLEAWVPRVYQPARNPDGSINRESKSKMATGNVRQTFFRILRLIQARLQNACNDVIKMMWLEEAKPLAPLDPDDPAKRRRMEPKPDERGALDTLAYRVLGKSLPGGEGDDAVPAVASNVTGAVSRRLHQFYVKQRKRSSAVPYIGPTWPIWLKPSGWCFTRADGLNLAVNVDGTWWEIGLRSHRKSRRRAPDVYIRAILAKLVPGEQVRQDDALGTASPTDVRWLPGTLGLQYVGRKWYVLIQYRQPRPAALTVPNAMVVHCGLKNFAVAMDLEDALGRGRGLFIDGIDITDARARFRARRRAIQHASKLRKPGHGCRCRARREQADQKEAQFVDSWVRRAAARIVRLAQQKKARIYFMDLKNIRKRVEDSDMPDYIKPRVHQAPWFKLKDFIEQGAAKVGLPFDLYKSYYHTKRCPRCGIIDAAAVDYKRWKYACVKCGYAGHLDRVGCENAFIDLGLANMMQFPASSAYEDAVRNIREMADMAGMGRAPRERRGGDGKTCKGSPQVGKGGAPKKNGRSKAA